MKSVSREGRKFTSEFYQAGNFILYNSQEEAGDNQRLRQINAVWLTENREAINVDCVVVHHVKVWLENLPESENYDYRIREILYIHNNRSKIRQIHQQHQLPNQHNFQRLSFPLNLQHLKFFIDLYYNDFDAFVSSIIVDCWVKIAKTCKAVFKSTYILVDEYNDYILLKKRLEQVTEALLKVFRETFSNLPNLHALHHLPEIARNFGMLVNTSVSLKEAVHGLYKRTVLHTNKKDLSMDLSKRDNTLQTLRYLLDGGLDTRYDEINNFFTNFANDTILHKLLDDWFMDYGNNLKFKSKDVYKNFSAIIQRRVNYYDSIQFTVHLESDVYVNITLRVGEAIDVEVADSHGEQSYALIRVIMIHQDDSGNNNPFLLIDWFYRNGNVDSVTGFPIYGLQKKRCRFMVSPSTSNNSRSTT
ncbi:unnamed protein product [Rhizophagus irregularis]|uniref:BAH domain-containing protein n=2 Tax=Rhizophagus irregularis TaxID=588596 RepID=A0A915ZMT8_9GLOM|nr:unnamed protein product [Rhizophagus irregularis]